MKLLVILNKENTVTMTCYTESEQYDRVPNRDKYIMVEVETLDDIVVGETNISELNVIEIKKQPV